MLVEATLTDFAAASASREPTPGGGSVAAYVGALGAALGAMAARFTEGRKGFEHHADALASEINRLDALREELLELVDLDAAAYAGVGAAYGLPKSTADEQATRREAIQAALRASMQAPLRTCRVAVEGLTVLDALAGHCNPNLFSDVVVGAHDLGASYRSAWVNVLINLASLEDTELVETVRAEGATLVGLVDAIEARIAEAFLTSLQR